MLNMHLESSSFVVVSEMVDALSEFAISFDCGEGRALFRQGDSPIGLFVVRSGNVEIKMKDVVGNILVRVPVQPGSLLGLPAVVGNVPYSLSAEAKKDAQVSVLPQKDFARLMLTKPGMAIPILQVLAAEVPAARSMLVV
jgi:CRP/FNR family transcriptional regulator, cyclic AMP receptor protein